MAANGYAESFFCCTGFGSGGGGGFESAETLAFTASYMVSLFFPSWLSSGKFLHLL